MKLKHILGHRCCAVISTMIIGLGMQCFAHAGFAVNQQGANADAIYSANASNAVPKFLTKKEAMQLLGKEPSLDTVIAYNIDEGKTTRLNDAPDQDLFFYNPYTRIIAVGLTKKETVALAQSPRQVYFAVQGESLSQTVQRWLAYDKLAPNKLFWQSEYDYEIQFPSDFYGDLLTANGALDHLLKSFANKDFAFNAKKMSNNVVVIQDRKFQQSIVAV